MAIKTLSYKEYPKVPSLPTPDAGYLGVTVCLTSDGKPYYCDGSTWIDLSLTGGGGGLTPTAIKTSGYTAAANDLVRCNSSAGSFTVSLPSSPADGTNIAVFDITNSAVSFPILVAPGGGKLLEGDSSGLSVNVNGAYVSLCYISATTNWKISDTYVNTEIGINLINPFLLMGA